MPVTGAFEVEGVIVEVLPNGIFRAELPNGHQLLAYLAGRAKQAASRVRQGGKVRLELSPCDLSKGRILLDPSKILES